MIPTVQTLPRERLLSIARGLGARLARISHRNPRKVIFVSDDTLALTRAVRPALAIVVLFGMILFMAPQVTEVIAIELEANSVNVDRLARTFASVYLFCALLLVYMTDMIITMERRRGCRQCRGEA